MRASRSPNELAHRAAVAERHLSVIPAGATVAFTDASAKGKATRCAVVITRDYPNLEATTEFILDPATGDANMAELAAIIAATEFLEVEFIVTDSITTAKWIEDAEWGGPTVIYVPGDAEVPGHDRAHDLSVAARKEAEG